MWTELIFVVGRDCVEPWSDALLEAGALSVQAEDADDGSPDEQAIFGEPGQIVADAGHAARAERLAPGLLGRVEDGARDFVGGLASRVLARVRRISSESLNRARLNAGNRM